MKLQYGSKIYSRKGYDTKARFASYWHQINEILQKKPKNVLEIGVGNSFVSDYLKKKGVKIKTLDINKKFKPSITGSVLDIPFKESSFDLVACCEVLEHLPYDNFPKALSEIFRVAKHYTVISLPDTSRAYRFSMELPKIGIIKKLIFLPRLIKKNQPSNKSHFWEIGQAAYPLKRIISDIKKAGFNIEKTYRVFDNPYHRFFILKK